MYKALGSFPSTTKENIKMEKLDCLLYLKYRLFVCVCLYIRNDLFLEIQRYLFLNEVFSKSPLTRRKLSPCTHACFILWTHPPSIQWRGCSCSSHTWRPTSWWCSDGSDGSSSLSPPLTLPPLPPAQKTCFWCTSPVLINTLTRFWVLMFSVFQTTWPKLDQPKLSETLTANGI